VSQSAQFYTVIVNSGTISSTHPDTHTQTVNTDIDKHTCNNAMKIVAVANVTALCPTTNSSLSMQPLPNIYSHVSRQQESGTVTFSGINIIV
jgi:hypothetical protein